MHMVNWRFKDRARGGISIFRLLFILFLAVPLIEIIILIQLGKAVGTGFTIALILITALLGAMLAKQQGFYVWNKVNAELAAGILPGNYLLESLIILGGALVLLTPGIITDILGLLCMLPASRRLFREIIKKYLKYYIRTSGGYRL